MFDDVLHFSLTSRRCILTSFDIIQMINEYSQEGSTAVLRSNANLLYENHLNYLQRHQTQIIARHINFMQIGQCIHVVDVGTNCNFNYHLSFSTVF